MKSLLGMIVTMAVVGVVVIVTYTTVTGPVIRETGELWRGIADALTVN
jgi:hypothetical protein